MSLQLVGEDPLSSQRRRTKQARRFPLNTCPASRVVHAMGECMARGQTYQLAIDDPKEVAASLLAVVEALWKLRTQSLGGE